jgi:hypothetical protein
MRATKSLFCLSLIPLTSLQRTHLFHPIISHLSRLRTMALSRPSKYCPTTGSYSPAPRSEDRMTYSLLVASTSLKRTLLRPRATSSGKARLNRLPGSPRKRWWAKRCVRQRTFTLKERKGNKCTGLSLSRMGGRRATRESGRESCSFTEASRRSRILCMYSMLKRFTGPQGSWDDQWSTRWNPNVFAHQEYFVVAINPTGSTTFGQGSFLSHSSRMRREALTRALIDRIHGCHR